MALVEMRRIGLETTGNTTAKLTVGHRLVYAKLSSSYAPRQPVSTRSRTKEAISQLHSLAVDLAIDCDWEPASNYVYTESSGRLDSSRKSGRP